MELDPPSARAVCGGGGPPPTTLRRSLGGGGPMLSEGHPPHRAICCRSNISAPQTGWAGLYVHQL